jgi:hypothetical protein
LFQLGSSGDHFSSGLTRNWDEFNILSFLKSAGYQPMLLVFLSLTFFLFFGSFYSLVCFSQETPWIVRDILSGILFDSIHRSFILPSLFLLLVDEIQGCLG